MARNQLEALGRCLVSRLAEQPLPSERIGTLMRQLSTMPEQSLSPPPKHRQGQARYRSLTKVNRRNIPPKR
jgi:hypothetical protein